VSGAVKSGKRALRFHGDQRISAHPFAMLASEKSSHRSFARNNSEKAISTASGRRAPIAINLNASIGSGACAWKRWRRPTTIKKKEVEPGQGLAVDTLPL